MYTGEVRNSIAFQSTPRPAAARPAEASSNLPSDSVQLSGAPVAADAGDKKELPEYVPGQVLVKFRAPLTQSATRSLEERFGATVLRKFDMPESLFKGVGGHIYQLQLKPGQSVEAALEQFKKESDVAYAEPNYVLHHMGDPVSPNDLDSRLWGLNNTGQTGGKNDADIDAPEAWAITTGKNQGQGGPLIAVIDTGIDYRHPDLAANIWTNPGEIPGNGIDDDGNGFVDDVHGFDFANNDGDPFDDHSHGTHCTGTIGAVGNNDQGVVGVQWNANMMGLKFLSGSGSGSTADAIEAVLYATKMGVRVTSNSWGGGGYSQALYDALKASPALHIFAAGNESNNNDRRAAYPASYDLDNIVSVAALDHNDALASFSNYGATTVDLGAPGVRILSTTPNNDYKQFSGTSMATPHVAGAAGLILAQYPDLTNEQLKARLMNTTDPVDALRGKCVSGGRLNVANALEEDNVAPAAPPEFGSSTSTATSVTLNWLASGDDGLEGTASRYELRFSDKPIVEGAPDSTDQISWDEATPFNALPSPAPSGTPESVRVLVPPTENGKTYYFALRAIDNLGNRSELSNTAVTVGPAAIPFKDDMEGGVDNWTLSGTWGQVDAGLERGKVMTDSPNGSYADNTNSALTSMAFDLSNVLNPQLNFRIKHDLENGYDNAYVEVSNDGGSTWSQVDKFTGAADWSKKTYDLKAYEGQNIQVRFRLQTDSSVTMDGVYLDDVMVAGDPRPAEPPPPPEPPPQPEPPQPEPPPSRTLVPAW